MKTFGILAFLSICGGFGFSAATGCTTLCTNIGCVSGVTTSLEIDGGVAALESAAVRVCRESDCVDGSITVDGESAVCDLADSDDFFTSCQVTTDGVVSFSVELRTDDVEDAEAYSFTVTSSTGEELASAEGVVTYEKTEINGSGCGYCYTGSL